jgi:CubicO group peptidase (beta-lactamase class C family)
VKPSLFIFLAILILTSCQSKKQEAVRITASANVDSLTAELKEFDKSGELAGFAVAVFDNDSVLYQNGFGFANKDQKRPYTPTSKQLIASISKTFIGVSLMMAVEQGLMNLDDNVNQYLDFRVANPEFPNEVITLRHLATHTSGIGSPDAYNRTYLFSEQLNKKDWPEPWHDYIDIYNKNTTVPMEILLENVLTPRGVWYSEDSYLNSPPGTVYEYSNIGASLLALAIETAVGQPYSAFVKERIFNPLHMEDSSWEPSEEDEYNGVTYYIENGNPIPDYKIITYPDGGVLSTVEDMVKYGQEMLRCSQGKGKLISKDSFKAMTAPQFQNENLPDAICWDLSFSPLIGHAGNEFGSSTLFYFNPGNETGRILFSNSSTGTKQQEEVFYGIFNLLFKYDLR